MVQVAQNKIPEFVTIDPGGNVQVNFHSGQGDVMLSAARFILMLAGTQSGKTSFGPWWLLNEIKQTMVEQPGQNDYLALTTTYPLFTLKMLPAMLELFVPRYGRYWPTTRTIELRPMLQAGRGLTAKNAHDPMWGRVILMSIGGSGGIEAATAKAAWLDEAGQDAWDLNDWEAVERRLSLAMGRALLTTTVYNSGWIKSEIYDRWTNGDPDYEVVQFDSTENPAFPQAEFDRQKAKMPDWKFQMYYQGRFAKPAGLILGDFTDEMLVDPFAIPKDWHRVNGIDFGGANTAGLWAALNPKDERWYLYREFLGGGVSTAQHAARTLDHDEGLSVDYWGGAGSETQNRMDWRNEGVLVLRPPVGDVEVGISRIIELLRTDKIRVFRTMTGLRDEISKYRRKLDEMGQPTDVIADKATFHRVDCLRYLVNGILGPLEPEFKIATARARG